MATHRLLLECLPASENVSRLRADGKITADMTSVWIGFGAIELKREVRLEHRRFDPGPFSYALDAKDACAVSGSTTAGQCARIAAAISIAFHTDHQHSVRQRGNGGSKYCAS
jgi:hypothetical protein